jgi:hypothetical protein
MRMAFRWPRGNRAILGPVRPQLRHLQGVRGHIAWVRLMCARELHTGISEITRRSLGRCNGASGPTRAPPRATPFKVMNTWISADQTRSGAVVASMASVVASSRQ